MLLSLGALIPDMVAKLKLDACIAADGFVCNDFWDALEVIVLCLRRCVVV